MDGARLADLAQKKAIYQEFTLFGQRAKDAGMDLRLVVGSWLWFLLNMVMTWLEGRMSDPALTNKQMHTLLDRFGPALVLFDRMLSQSVDQKKAVAAARSSLGAQVAEAQGKVADAEAALSVCHDLPASRQALLEAARRHQAQAATLGTRVGRRTSSADRRWGNLPCRPERSAAG